MKVTKFGHCCLLIEEAGLRILTDPGGFSSTQNEVKNIDVILITHEHGDHLHVESVKAVLTNNPQAKIYTNSGVGKILSEQGIKFELLEKGAKTAVKELVVESLECPHEPIYKTVPIVQNTGYFIGPRLFYPGDSFTQPGRPVEILALPIAGPWMKVSQAIEYATVVQPKKCFPVHDAIIKTLDFYHPFLQRLLAGEGISMTILDAGGSAEF